MLINTGGPFYVLRTCDKDGRSHGGFQWPKSGMVSCPDWIPNAQCGNGLHGFLDGKGDGFLADWTPEAKWLVLKIDQYIDLEGKVKFPSAEVLYYGDMDTATKKIADLTGKNVGIIGACVTVGDNAVAEVGDRGTATAGHYGTVTARHGGTATAGDGGTATAGDGGTATAGDDGTATAGDDGTATAGYGGTATAGYGGTATAGYGGTATAGYLGTATAGYGGTATAGDNGTAIAGCLGTATAGDYGTATVGEYGKVIVGAHSIVSAGIGSSIIADTYTEGFNTIVKLVGKVGSDGILPNVRYRAINGKFVRV